MLELKGNNLGKRHHELNSKVREAFDSKMNFDQINLQEEKSDVDKLFKIDLANLYKNIDYISDTLKSGDSLYITRALKCPWLYDDEFMSFTNPESLHHNIFPFMSIKMKKKTLATIATNITNANRAHDFYKYCVSSQLDNIASDYLVKTSESVKSDFIEKHIHIDDNIHFEHFFGNSIHLVKLYLEKRKQAKTDVHIDLYKLRYLFTSLGETYLNILEEYTDVIIDVYPYASYETFEEDINLLLEYRRFGLKISKEIVLQYKKRILDKPWLYLRVLNLKMVIKYSTTEEIKKLIVAMLPDVVNYFWNMDFYNKYIDFFNMLPADKKFTFLKKIFNEKYPEDAFEMSLQFYRLKYYEILSAEERNAWALTHLKQKKELLGQNRDFLWYKFVKFDTAFNDIKKMIFTTTCQDIRSDMIEVLVESASDLTHLEKLISYYYERHVNENSNRKERFIDKIIDQHNVFEFTENCWSPFHKLLHSINFNTSRNYDRYTMLVIIYSIIHYNKIPETLESSPAISTTSYLFPIHLKKLTLEQKDVVYRFFIDIFINKIRNISENACTGDEEEQNVKDLIVGHIYSILNVMEGFEKTKDDCPEFVLNFIKLYSEEFKHHIWFQTEMEYIEEAAFLRFLKKDKMLLINQLPKLKECPYHYMNLSIKRLLQKLKIYFFNDIMKAALTFFEEWLAEKYTNESDRDVDLPVFAIFQLADENHKINFILKHVPTETKIQHDVIDKDLLRIQEAICRYAYFSRPPVPLEKILQYLKGDYVHFCLPMFNSYSVNLPLPQAIKFIEALLNAPVSIQKHGLRLAFKSYSVDNLTQLILSVWKKTNNVSLRVVIYKSLFEKMKNVNTVAQSQLFEILKKLTLDLNESDQEDIFQLMVSASLPGNLNGNYLQAAWTAVQKLPDSSLTNINRKNNVIYSITSYIEQIDRYFCRAEIIDEHIQNQLLNKEILRLDNSNRLYGLIDKKWDLTAKYITHFDSAEQQNDSSKLLETIMKNCSELWHEVCGEKYVVRAFLYSFINKLVDNTDYRRDRTDKSYIVPIYEQIITFFMNTWPLREIYKIVLTLKLMVLARNSVGPGKFNADKKATTYGHLSVTDVSDSFAKSFVDLKKDLMTKQQLYYSFYSDIADIISHAIKTMTSWTCLDNETLKVNVCLALTKFNNKEAYMFASNILPVQVQNRDLKVLHSSVKRLINESNDEEVRTIMYHKFVLPDFTF